MTANWVQELAAGRVPPELLSENGTARVAPPAVTTAAPEPPRVCLGTQRVISNPGFNGMIVESACGKPQRQRDALTFEKESVTCPLCKQLMQDAANVPGAREKAAASSLDNAAVAPPCEAAPGFTRPAQPNLPDWDDLSARKVTDHLLNVEALEEKRRWLQGELAAVDVLLKAAKARAKAAAKVEAPLDVQGAAS
jgi:hypothetical protein